MQRPTRTKALSVVLHFGWVDRLVLGWWLPQLQHVPQLWFLWQEAYHREWMLKWRWCLPPQHRGAAWVSAVVYVWQAGL
jgi:hypothetical protein